MSFAMKVIGITILAVIAISIAAYVFAKYLLPLQPPLPETEKARFLRALTCSYAMCARNGCDSIIIDIGFLDKQNKISCYGVCKDWENQSKTGYKCGQDFKLEFNFSDDVIYYADKKFTAGIPNVQEYKGIYTDINQYKNAYWYNKIADSKCSATDKSMTFCKYDHGLLGQFPQGKCDGVIEKVANSCQRLGGGGGWNDAEENTGHLWIGPDIINNGIAKCDLLGENGYTGNALYANCTFNKDNKLYIWTEVDMYNDWFNTHYCPELILCSS
jgi:hypothetical protein